ncbi:M20/M25/M40 family metallo-hydrolase [Fibrisoma montanum]|uniref:M20/M25/M40 family metallo-hydrolase n=1 Tax=Fibrisoma montanum TaxID=2305895 RepID=A0A418M4D5_9BACT|nr:M20/M25/M40 family metallo-hydrolase [Fibrisoma montanum]RIV20677.1 M20/M25/M40 family metallo-hydrolase [Fibrisoma montanum]
MRFPVLTFLQELTNLPHRGAATPCEREAAALIGSYLTEMGATVRTEPFRTPKTYVTVVYWLIGGLLLGLVLVSAGSPVVRWVGVGVAWAFAGLAWLFFNWRYSPVTRFPVQHTAYNVVGHWPAPAATHKVLLMAHYDTAPVSLLYGARQVSNFRASLIVSLSLMGVAAGAATLEALGNTLPLLTYLRYGCIVYFLGQALLSTIGYYLHGYTSGASDNATGVAAALATADRLRQAGLPGLDLEVVLTSAEEVGMIGAQHYVRRHRTRWTRDRTMVVNFDTLGAGMLTVVEQTGTVEVIKYDSVVTKLARTQVESGLFRGRAKLGRWHTADFDSVWFVRAGIPALGLCALDENGQMPRIHQPADTFARVDTQPLLTAVELAEVVVQQWISGQTVRSSPY